MWTSLIPMIIGSAIVPIQIIITILLLRSPGRAFTAAAWVGGMTALRLLQGVLFGFVFTSADDTTTTTDGASDSGSVVSGLLLVLAVVLYVTAIKQILHDEDPDAPPPTWMTMTESVGPGKAFLLGAGVLLVGAKFWVFTLSAVGAIDAENLSQGASIGTFVLFVILAESIHLTIVGLAIVAPKASTGILDRAYEWLGQHNRVIMIVLGFVFGTWFLLKALDGLGVV